MKWTQETAIAELTSLRDEIESLRDKKLWCAEHTRWNDQTRTTLETLFGPESRRTKQFLGVPWLWKGPMALSRIYPEDSLDEYNARAYSTGLECARGLLQADLDFVQRYGVPIELESSTVTDAESSGNAVFIVHGRNEGHKQSVARVLEQLGMEALILHERPDGGRTIIEKLEEYGNAKFAIVVLSADDVGGLSGDTPALCPRARQNVILELGYFLGRLGRGRVCALYEEGVELPSDYAGVLYKLLDSAGHWKYAMADELRNAGFDVDKNSVK